MSWSIRTTSTAPINLHEAGHRFFPRTLGKVANARSDVGNHPSRAGRAIDRARRLWRYLYQLESIRESAIYYTDSSACPSFCGRLFSSHNMHDNSSEERFKNITRRG